MLIPMSTGRWRHLLCVIPRAIVCCICLLGMTVGAHASSEHLREFKAYRSAFERGDIGEAMARAEAAWRAAEVELGDDETTAVLAYNYARLAFSYVETAAAARQAYKRVLAMSENDIGPFRPGDMRIALLEMDLIAKSDSEADPDQLARLLRARLGKGQPTDLSAHAWKSLAADDLKRLDRIAAAEHADIAVEQALALQPADVDLATEALLLSAVARLSAESAQTDGDQLRAAIDRLDRLVSLYTPPGNPVLDRRHATALEWRDAAQAQLASRRRAGTQMDPESG